MKIKLVPVITMLVAGLIAWIMCFVFKRRTIDMMIIVLVVVIIFFIVGFVAEKIFEKFLVVEEDESDELGQDMDEEGEGSAEDLENFDIKDDAEETGESEDNE